MPVKRAAVVGSGRVGRARILALGERAALAARAQIRHAPTDDDERLDQLSVLAEDDELYRDIKAQAHDAVDVSIHAHRQQS